MNGSLEASLVLVTGAGGVGKTTNAAMIALASANRGRRVLLITTDPARRLADALGLSSLGDEVQSVPLETNRGGSLYAAMIDAKSSLDDTIARVAPNDAIRDRIFDNVVYQSFSTTLARAHGYAVVERLHDAIVSKRYDQVVVDTPPSSAAHEIFEAPDRLVRFLDQRVLRWFSRAATVVEGRSGRRPAVTKVLEMLAGRGLVEALFSFVTDLAQLRDGFELRARFLRDLLRSGDTAFVVVTTPARAADVGTHMAVGEAQRRGARLLLLVNESWVPEPCALLQPIRRMGADVGDDGEGDVVLDRVSALRTRFADLNEKNAASVAQICSRFREVAVWCVPAKLLEPTSLEVLLELHEATTPASTFTDRCRGAM